MAKNTGPLFSNEARGSLGKFLTFSKRNSGQQVRWQKKQKIITPSWAQSDEQSLYRVIYARWLSFSDAQRQAYNDEAKSENLRISGWNLFLQKAVADPYIELGLCGYWTMNRPNFGTILDISKNGNIGTLKPSWPSNAPVYVPSKNKKLGNALSFDGSDDYVNCGSGASLDITGAITIEAWAKRNSLNLHGFIISKGNVYAMGYASTGGTDFYAVIRDSGGVAHPYIISPTWDVAKWHHYVWLYKPNVRQSFYLDGVMKYNVVPTWDLGSAVESAKIGYIDYGINSKYYSGLIDDARIYNRALSPAEIAAIYNMTK